MSRLAIFHRRLVNEGASNRYERIFLSALIPVSYLYGGLNWLRSKCYDYQILRSYRAEVPVVSVGNLAVGGTGKTPVVDWLVKAFLQQGKRPAVISRGYGGSFTGEVGVVSGADGLLLPAAESGDEPYLLARRNPQALVLIAKKRAMGVKAAIESYAADVVILDDGFQHRAVARDLDLLLLDAKCPFGNRLPIPGGVLREFLVGYRRADLLLLTRSESETVTPVRDKPSWTSQHQIADYALTLKGDTVDFFDLDGKKLLAFAGIAHPDQFFKALEAAGLNIVESISLNDHVQYSASALAEVTSLAKNCDALITTEKDAVKLSSEMFDLPCYQVPMSILIDREAELLAEISQRLWRNPMTVRPELMEILACPKCKQPVVLADDQLTISCEACRLRYPVRDEIPVMLIDEAESF